MVVSPCSWVGASVLGNERRRAEPEVVLGAARTGVAQQNLDRPKVGARRQQMGGKGSPQVVGRQGLKAGPPAGLLDQPSIAFVPEPLAAPGSSNRQKERVLLGCAAPHELGPALVKV